MPPGSAAFLSAVGLQPAEALAAASKQRYEGPEAPLYWPAHMFQPSTFGIGQEDARHAATARRLAVLKEEQRKLLQAEQLADTFN